MTEAAKPASTTLDRAVTDARERVEKASMHEDEQKVIIDTLVDALEWSVRLMEAMGQSAHRSTLNKARDALAFAKEKDDG